MNKNIDKIEQLLIQYSFIELSEEAKEMVRSEMSEAEYSQSREILAAANELNKANIPPLPKNVYADLKRNIRQRSVTTSSSSGNQWLYPTLGLIIGALAMAGWFWSSEKLDIESKSEIKETIIVDTVYVHSKDTIYIPAKPEIKIITKEVIKYIEKEVPSPFIALKKDAQSEAINKIDLVDFKPLNIGTTIGEEEELMNLLEEMHSDALK